MTKRKSELEQAIEKAELAMSDDGSNDAEHEALLEIIAEARAAVRSLQTRLAEAEARFNELVRSF